MQKVICLLVVLALASQGTAQLFMGTLGYGGLGYGGFGLGYGLGSMYGLGGLGHLGYYGAPIGYGIGFLPSPIMGGIARSSTY